ncbi:MAG: ArsR family transcriptional regulator [Candidatus Heimdallarchaeaceae archaeon]
MKNDNKSDDEIKRELDELKRRNEELEAMVRAVYKRLEKVNGHEISPSPEPQPHKNSEPLHDAHHILERDIAETRYKRSHGKGYPPHKEEIHEVGGKALKPKMGPRRVSPGVRPPRPPDQPASHEVHRILSSKEIQKAREELIRAREELKKARERARQKRDSLRLEARRRSVENAKKYDKSPYMFTKDFDLRGFEETISKYVEGVLSAVSKNLERTVRSAISTSKKTLDNIAVLSSDGSKKKSSTYPYDYRGFSVEELEEYLDDVSDLLSAIGDKNRLHILKLLELKPEYQKDLSEKTGLRGGTFKHHTDILAKAGLITQEAVRGRYLITQLGVEALKLAEILYTRKRELLNDESSVTDLLDDTFNEEDDDDDIVNIHVE